MPTVEIRMPNEEKEGTEASLAKWLRQPGEAVKENEPLLEITTDKVTIEIAAPASGVLREQCKAQSDAVLPGELLGRIETEGVVNPVSTAKPLNASETGVAHPSLSADEQPHEYSPAVRRLLRENNLDPRSIPKTTRGGRLTIDDVSAFVALSGPQRQTRVAPDLAPAISAASFTGRRVPLTPMRKSIAAHMLRSVQMAPHVTSVFEADLSRVLADRESRKAANADDVPSVTAYLIHAALHAIQLVPEVNSKWHDDALEIFDAVNFGFGTALDNGGLVVPVIRNAHTMDLLTLSQHLRELTQKARSGKLTHADMEGGTFTLSNHGVSGSLLAAPIILPHGQAAILGAGKLQRRVVAGESGGRELVRIRPMMYVTLTVDHRILDAQQTNGFLTAFVAALENPLSASV